MSVLVCFALKEEAAPFRKIAAGKPDVAILIVGIGRQNAERSVREYLASNKADIVFTSGFAGGLNPDLKIGDVVFEIANHQSSIANALEPPDVGCYEKLIAAGAKP